MSPQPRVYRCEAVVLRRHDFGEADRLVTVITPDDGKKRLLAKGVRRVRSRKAGHLEPFTRVRLLLSRGRDLDIITQAEALDLFPALRANLVRIGQASYVAELLDSFAVEEGGTRLTYHLLVDTLERLARGDRPEPLLRYYELRLLDLVGYRPELFQCLHCKNEVRPEPQFFSFSEGGILCPSCGHNRRGATAISLSALKVLRHYQRSNYAAVTAVEVRAVVLSEIEGLIQGYLTYIIERRLNSPVFLKRIRSLETGESTS